MGIAFQRPVFLLLLIALPATYLVWRRWPPPLRTERGRVALGVRLAIVSMLVLALAGTAVYTQPQHRALVAVVDLSASLRGNLDAEAAAVRDLQASKGPDDLFGVVTFGHDAEVELPPTRNPQFDSFQTQPDPNYTNVADGLRLGAGIIPSGYARQLVLVSDGRQNLGDAAAAVAELKAEGVRVDILPVGTEPTAEALVSAVVSPTEVRVGDQTPVAVDLHSSGPASGQLLLLVDGAQIEVREVELPAGASEQDFVVDGLQPGLHRIRAELTVQPDTYTQNNVGEAAVRVLGQPAVLVLEGSPGGAASVAPALRAAGMQVTVMASSEAPADTGSLAAYDSIVLVDTSADSFPPGTLSALASFVQDLGHGLVTIGGPDSYGPGGWRGTPLEDALPVRMELPPRKEKASVAVVLVMETMEDPNADQVALGAAESVINQLSPQDQVAVTDGSHGFVFPLTYATDKASLDRKLEAATLGDPPSYLTYLKAAGDALVATSAALKHIVILGDGDSMPGTMGGQGNEQASDYQNYLGQLQSQGVTTSAVGVDTHNNPVFMSFMQDLARWGGGRYYQTSNHSQVPQLLLQESTTSLRPWFEQEPFTPVITSESDLLSGLANTPMPQLTGYVVTTSKPGADILLSSDKEDPLLATWQYGLGRSVSWTSDSVGRWTAAFLKQPLSADLFARMVRWTLPDPTKDNLQLSAQLVGDSLQVKVLGPQTQEGTAQLTVVDPDLQKSDIPLTAESAGQWRGRVAATTTGTYLIHAVLQDQTGILGQGEVAIPVPYSPEFLNLGRDEGLLGQLAAFGGRRLDRADMAWSQPLYPATLSNAVFVILLVLVAILWPLDIALRRITLTPREIVRAVGSVARWHRPEEIELAIPPELARLRERIRPVRQRRGTVPVVSEASEEGSSVIVAAGGRKARPYQARVPAVPAVPASQQPEKEAGAEVREEEALSARLLAARRRRQGGSGR